MIKSWPALAGVVLLVSVMSLASLAPARLPRRLSEAGDLREARAFLEKKGYQIISADAGIAPYVLTKERLARLPYAQYWKVQKVAADGYLGRTIKTYKFTVRNHPLDKFPGNTRRQTQVFVMMVGDQIIGGYALPDVEGFTGGVYPLEGAGAVKQEQ